MVRSKSEIDSYKRGAYYGFAGESLTKSRKLAGTDHHDDAFTDGWCAAKDIMLLEEVRKRVQ